MADSNVNGNGARTLKWAFGLGLTLVVGIIGYQARVIGDMQRDMNDDRVRIEALKEIAAANKFRLDSLDRQLLINTSRIGSLEQDVASVNEYVRPGYQRLYKRRYNDSGEVTR